MSRNRKFYYHAYAVLWIYAAWTVRALRGILLLHGTKARFAGLLMLIISNLVPPRIRMRVALLGKAYQKLYELLIGKPGKIRIAGTTFIIPDLGSLAVVSPHFEPWMGEHMRELDTGDVFIDVGAHVGKYTLPYARIVGDEGLVIAVEADPNRYNCLLEGIRINGLSSVIALNIAAWSEKATLRMYRGANTVERPSKYGYIEVQAKPLDDVLQEIGVRGVALIKIDVDGSEYEVVKGLVKTLKNKSPKVIIEVADENRERIENLIRELEYTFDPIRGSKGPLSSYYVVAPLRHAKHS